MILACKTAPRYKGAYPPHCNDGTGSPCLACRITWKQAQKQRLNPELRLMVRRVAERAR